MKKYHKILKKSNKELVGLSKNYFQLSDEYIIVEINEGEYKKLIEILWKKVQNS
jgi:hypothetical protein